MYKSDIKESINHFASSAFENICIQYLQKKNIQNELEFRFKKIGRWWNNSEEIDLMAYDTKNLILGECKFKNSKFTFDDFSKLKEKYNSDKNIIYYLFSKSGFDKKLTNLKDKNVKLIDLKEIVLLNKP